MVAKQGFLQDKWCGPWSLKELFPNLFAVAADQYGVFADAGQWVHNIRSWQLSWSRDLLAVEEEEMLL